MITQLDPKKKKPAGVHVVSASQVRTFQRCERRWGFKYIDKLADPVGKGAILGTAVHDCLEKYFSGGDSPTATTREGQLAGHAIRSGEYPGRATELLVETPFLFEIEGVFFQGYVDLSYLNPGQFDAGPIPPPQPDRGIPVIQDHKTSSNPAKYGLTSDTLPDDVQALIYAVWGFDFYEADTVRLKWTYLPTPPRVHPKIFSVEADVGRTATEKRFRWKVLGTAKAIVAAKKEKTTGNELTPNPDACHDYGKPCAFSLYCTLDRSQRLATVFGESNEMEEQPKETLREMLARKRGKAPPPRVNTPEHAAGVKAAQETSRAVEQVTGGPKQKAETVRAIANAVVNETDPAEVKAKAEQVLGVAASNVAARSAPSLTQPQILVALRDGDRSAGLVVSCSKPKASGTVPYVAGRTLSALVKNSLVVSKDEDDGTKRLSLTSAGLDKAEKIGAPEPAPASSVAPQPQAPVNAAQPAPAPAPTPAPSNGAPVVSATFVSGPTEHATFFRELLSNTEIETPDAVAKFDAYVKRFPMGAPR